jgi:uncharacterized protein YjbI with pentapeptide repeats
LRTYFDKVSDLLLDEKLSSNPKIQSIVRARTLAALHILNTERKGIVLQFLHDSDLLRYVKSFLYQLDLSNTDLNRIDLQEATMVGAILSGANLGGALLSGADLQVADLQVANLWGATMRIADLQGANLRGADLSITDLTGVNLRGANLREALQPHFLNSALKSLEHD